MNMNTTSWGKSKLVLLGSVLFLSSFFFGGQASAETCTWTASSSVIIGTNANWDNGSGASCTLTADDNLVFDGSVTSSVATATGDVEFNSISIESNYTGTINFSNVSVSTTANFIQNGGLINFLYTSGSKNFFVGGNMGIASSTDVVNTDGRGIFQVVGNLTVSSTFSSMVTTTNIISIGGNLLVPGTFAFKQTVFTGSSKIIGGTGSINIASSTINGSYSLASSVTSSLDLTISGSGSLDLGTYSLYAAGSITNNNVLVQTGGSIVMTGTGSLIGNGTNTSLYNLNVNGTTNLYGTVTTTNILTVGGTLSALSSTLILSGTSTPFLNNGVFSAGTSNVVYSGVTSSIASTTYYNLTIDSTTSTLTGSTTIGSVFTLNSNKTLLGSDAVVTLSGSGTPFVKNGTFTPQFSDFLYTGVSNIATTTYYNLRANGTQTLNGDVSVGANFSVAGSMNQTSGTATMTGAAYAVGGYGSSSTFNNLTLGSSSVNSNLIGSITISNVLTSATGTLNMGSTSTINLVATGTPFVLNSAFTVNSSSVTYSGATANIASTTYYNLTVNGTDTLVGSVTTTNVLTINSGKTLLAGTNTLVLTGTGTPLLNNGTFTSNTSTVVYSGATVNLASTTYYNLTLNGATSAGITGSTTINNVLTVNSGVLQESVDDYLTIAGNGTAFSNASAARLATSTNRVNVSFTGSSVNIPSAVYYNLKIDSASSSLIGNVTTTNALIISSGKTLNAGSYTIVLNTNTGSVFQNSGTFNADTSNVYYANTGSVTVGAASYYTLTLGSGTYVLNGQTTSTNSFVNGGTLTLDTYNLVIASGTYANNGTVTGISYVKKQATGSGLSASTYTSGSGNGTGNSVSLTITDPTANDDGSTLDTITVTLTASNYSDSEIVTLTETGVATGIFSGTVPFYIINAKTNNNGKLDVSGSGNLSLSYSNGYGASGVTISSASYTGSSFSSGGSIGGGGSSPAVSSATTAATITVGPQTTSQAITLNLSATNATQVAISEDPGFAGASWDTYAPTKQFTLSSGAGEKTVYVKFRSAAGGVTSVYKVNVTLKSDYVVAPVVTPAATTPAAVAQFEVSNPDSKVVISPVKTLVYKPNSVVKYTYAYKNETTKTVKVKVVRSVVNAKGKVITKVTGSASITKGKTFKFNASSPLSNKVADGKYTVKVQILDFKTGKLVDENSFGITVKKPAPVVKKPVVKAPVKTVAKPAVKK